MKKHFTPLAILLLGLSTIDAQVGINTQAPHSNAALEVKPNTTTSPNAKTFILPQLPNQKTGGITPESNATNITAANQLDNGMMYFNTDTGCIDYWIASKGTWGSLCGTPPVATLTAITNDQDTYTYTYNSVAGTKTPPNINLLANVATMGGMLINTSEATQNTNGIDYIFNGQLYAGNQTVPLSSQGFPQGVGTFEYRALYDSDGDGTVDTFVTNQNGNPYTFTVKYQEIISNQVKNTTASQQSPTYSTPSFVMTLNDLTIPVKAGEKLEATYTINVTNNNDLFAAAFAFPAITDATAVPASAFSLTGSYTNKNSVGNNIDAGNLSTTNRDKNPAQGRGTDITTSGLRQTISITITYINNGTSTVNFSIAATQDINYTDGGQYFTVTSASVNYTTTNPAT
ncbi:hypothetical protein [Chryseobacterium sp. CT-SW4]|uniref:hypothetical protein n=1 Tax=Chryseobacterium sp. SW-1 TaxID=3157343 RepID=UPI003B01A6DE